ncbi:hypothetical protein BI081_gp140 [Mycobacterium phage Tonenili]|uniref:Uncharacterized protein n=1 Tax=Mycobacterium phage Tonenili TaxID=1891703 RepID=A0A1C9EHK2_9CAUD|nr:hypothetical protein BI081_gp140 [Mycobacterium phage Tonenili]AON96967.1 hypothetical protein SEA_TONENILI_249 [Mycobacterium phage Tonenili]
MMRPKLLVAASMKDAVTMKGLHPCLRSCHVLTPHTFRNESHSSFLFGEYTWTPAAKALPARTRWQMRQQLRLCLDEESCEQDFPDSILAW